MFCHISNSEVLGCFIEILISCAHLRQAGHVFYKHDNGLPKSNLYGEQRVHIELEECEIWVYRRMQTGHSMSP